MKLLKVTKKVLEVLKQSFKINKATNETVKKLSWSGQTITTSQTGCALQQDSKAEFGEVRRETNTSKYASTEK